MFKKSFLKFLAAKERVDFSFLEKQIKRGRVVIPLNKKKELPKPTAIGEGLKIKINTNLGISTEKNVLREEIEKLKISCRYGTDTVMDLSVGRNSRFLRKKLIDKSPLPVGTVPIYEVADNLQNRNIPIEKMTFDDFYTVIQEQAEEGVDFFTIHAAILKKTAEEAAKNRLGGIVSRGGAIIYRWMQANKKENFLFTNFTKILKLLKKYNITLSLGDALRPGAIADSTDTYQINELKTQSLLIKQARSSGVQVMVEGPGHIRLNEIAFNIALEKKICYHAPFYILGPLPTDIAAGYDHISAAIGSSIAALAGADFLCVVTPAEHLRLPSKEDIREGVIASKIAAHCVDILRFGDEAKRDNLLSQYRKKRDWKKIFPLTVDENKARNYRKDINMDMDICSMCGKYCSLKMQAKS